MANRVRLVSLFETITYGDGFEQVLVARSDAESSNRHHVVGTPMRHNGRNYARSHLKFQTSEIFNGKGRIGQSGKSRRSNWRN